MPGRDNRGSHYENHHQAAELQNLAAHTHDTAVVRHGQEDHLTGHEMSRRAQEHSHEQVHHSPHTVTEQEIAALAYELWQERGAAQGSPEQDWLAAEKQLNGQRT